jgi:ATPase family associated with various cellular activities (AAA)
MQVLNHSHSITGYISFLNEIIEKRIQNFANKEDNEPLRFAPIQIQINDSPINRFIAEHNITIEELIILLLALVPHVQPNLFDTIFRKNLSEGEFPEIGGARDQSGRYILPTGETALFLLCGMTLEERINASRLFSPDHFFARENILHLGPVADGEPRLSGKLILQLEYVELFTTGAITRPGFGPEFPAKLVTTKMEWNDLVLNPKTATQIDDIKVWLNHNNTLMGEWQMEKKIKPGYRALFYGPPGTGKTLTATLLGRQFQKDVYRIDLSQVISKYIGETEKNLEKVFKKAEYSDWILFFDEADALFSKRSNVQNAHDKYANQEVSYLLQRVEDFPGLIVLASNFKGNIDQAFIRRFNSIIHFPMPDKDERYAIWQTTIPAKAKIAEDINLPLIAGKYELSGSAIVSVIHYASLKTIHRNSAVILKQDLLDGIRREYEKEERVFALP